MESGVSTLRGLDTSTLQHFRRRMLFSLLYSCVQCSSFSFVVRASREDNENSGLWRLVIGVASRKHAAIRRKSGRALRGCEQIPGFPLPQRRLGLEYSTTKSRKICWAAARSEWQGTGGAAGFTFESDVSACHEDRDGCVSCEYRHLANTIWTGNVTAHI